MRNEYLIAVIFSALLIAMPFSSVNVFAQEEEEVDERNVGEAIVINVKDYEPKVVVASVLEENDVPVYAFLEGYTFGKFVGREEDAIEPFYGTPRIRRVKIIEEKHGEDYKIIYKRPKRYSLDNLGYVVVMLKKVEKEHEVPKSYTINLTARVEFYFARGWGIGEQDLVLPEDPDEKKWKEKISTDYSFWSGDGYIRVADISANKITLVVYDSSFKRIGKRTLSIGETSEPLTLRKVYGIMEDQFRLKLQDIVDPGAKRAYLRISVDGDTMIKNLVEGRSLYSGSEWKVEDIVRKVVNSKIMEEVTIKNMEDDRTTITKTYTYDKIYNTELAPESGIEIIKGDTIKEIVEKLKKGFPDVKFDYSATVFGDYKFNKSSFPEGTTLAKVLDELRNKEGLLHTYDKEKGITLGLFREFEKETIANPCTGVEKPAGDGEELRKYYYCKSIDEFREVVDNYPDVKDGDDVLWKEKSYYWIGKAYDALYGLFNDVVRKDAARRKALKAYRQVKSFNIQEVNGRIDELEKAIIEETNYEFITIDDAGRTVELQLEGVFLERAERSTALIAIDYESARQYREGEDLLRYHPEKNRIDKYDELKVKKILQDRVIIEKIYKDEEDEEEKKELAELKLKETITIGDVNFRLDKTDLKKRAVVTVLPGADEGVYSESSFSLNIPIEKRAIDLTPETIEKEINKYNKTIEDLDKIINSLNNLVTTLKKVCVYTFAFITLKNLLAGGSRAIARRTVMNEKEIKKEDKKGVEEPYTGWKDYCVQNSGRGEEYKYADYDVCMSENADEINQDIKEVQDSIDETNKLMKEIDFEKDGLNKFSNEVLKKDDGTYYLDPNKLKELYDCGEFNLKDARDLASLKFSNDDNYNKEIKRYDDLIKECRSIGVLAESKYEKGSQEYLEYKQSVIKYTQISPSKELGVEKLFGDEEEKFMEDVKKNIEGKKLYEVYKVDLTDRESDYNRVVYVTTKTDGGEVKTEEFFVKKYIHKCEGCGEKGIEKEVVTKGYTLYVSGNDEFFAVKTDCINEDYESTPGIDVDSEGNLNVIPLKGRGGSDKADFAEALGYDRLGNAVGFRVWNVGCDGEIGTIDDIRNDKKDMQEIAWNAYNRIKGKYKEGATIRLFGNNYVVGTALAIQKQRLYGPQCQDVMEQSDCTILYAVCDPVMCPASRCDLDGRWQVENVIQTGIVGSVFLCAPRFLRVPTIPVCLTGVLAGLQNIKTILQGYVECLKTAQVHDLSVGICDKIRSVFICELVWRELIAVLNVKGGIMDLISEKIFGQAEGGGEYLTFKESMQGVSDSVKFFTQEYAQTAFAAYRARSTDELGFEFCKAAFFGKAPWLGDFIDQISKPESPAQFTAVFSEMPWSDTMKESRYSVYYHIYAGEDQEATYSVFLRNKYDPKMGIVYVTEKCGGRRGRVEQGGFADYNVDCVAGSGFEEVCVEINGRTSCGFGKVSSAFALGYLNDLIVEHELKRDIDTEAECTPDSPTASPSLGILVGLEQTGIRPGTLRTGTVRVCSTLNPGEGTNPSDWRNIGGCGKDEKGRFLGYCWIDLRTVSIKDAERYEKVMETLDKTGLEREREMIGLDVWDKDESKEKLKNIDEEYVVEFKDDGSIEGIKNKSEDNYLRLIERYEEIIVYSVDFDTLAEAQFMIGMIYFKLAEMKKIPLKEEGEKDGEAEEPTEGSEEECEINNVYFAYGGKKLETAVKGKINLVVEAANCRGLPIEIRILEKKTDEYDQIKFIKKDFVKDRLIEGWEFTNPGSYLFTVEIGDQSSSSNTLLIVGSCGEIEVDEDEKCDYPRIARRGYTCAEREDDCFGLYDKICSADCKLTVTKCDSDGKLCEGGTCKDGECISSQV